MVHWPTIGRLCALFRLYSSHEFTRAQVKLTRAQARVGPGVDTPLVTACVIAVVTACVIAVVTACVIAVVAACVIAIAVCVIAAACTIIT